jgi:hypothetical protein
VPNKESNEDKNTNNQNNRKPDTKDIEKEDVKTIPEGERFQENVEPPPAAADNEDMV